MVNTKEMTESLIKELAFLQKKNLRGTKKQQKEKADSRNPKKF